MLYAKRAQIILLFRDFGFAFHITLFFFFLLTNLQVFINFVKSIENTVNRLKINDRMKEKKGTEE